MLADFHVHSSFSGDCDEPMEKIIQVAIQKGITTLCFTEHEDLDYPTKDIDFTIDLDYYSKQLLQYKEHYKNKIDILMGIELGMQPHLHKTLNALVNKYPFDFILASNHLAKGEDVYELSYFTNRTQKKAYLDYFEDMLENVKNYTNYDCYGHLDYIVRYGNFQDKKVYLNDFSELLDEILLSIIHAGKGIELNTSGIRKGLNSPHPNFEILSRYRKLGGEIITLGSDSHKATDLCCDWTKAKSLLKKAGFRYATIFKNRKPIFYSIQD